MIASGCTEQSNEGPCMADRSGSAAAAAKLPVHSAGLPGKEEFCFFVCPFTLGQIVTVKGPSSPPGAFATLRGAPR
jgi:hypothetical protein